MTERRDAEGCPAGWASANGYGLTRHLMSVSGW